MQNGSVQFGATLPMWRLVHHTLSVLHSSMLTKVCELEYSYWSSKHEEESGFWEESKRNYRGTVTKGIIQKNWLKDCTDLFLPKQEGTRPAEYPAWSPSRSPFRLSASSTKGCHLIPSWRCSIFHSGCKSAQRRTRGNKNSCVNTKWHPLYLWPGVLQFSV